MVTLSFTQQRDILLSLYDRYQDAVERGEVADAEAIRFRAEEILHALRRIPNFADQVEELESRKPWRERERTADASLLFDVFRVERKESQQCKAGKRNGKADKKTSARSWKRPPRPLPVRPQLLRPTYDRETLISRLAERGIVL